MAVSARKYLLLACAGVMGVVAATPARAANCPVPEIAGTWKRAAPGPEQALVRLEIIHRCSPGQHGVHSVIDGQDWTVRAFGACRPSNCSWGRTPGVSRQAGEVDALFRTFSAHRHVRAAMRGDLLEVSVLIDWHSDNREDDRSTVTFIRDE